MILKAGRPTIRADFHKLQFPDLAKINYFSRQEKYHQRCDQAQRFDTKALQELQK